MLHVSLKSGLRIQFRAHRLMMPALLIMLIERLIHAEKVNRFATQEARQGQRRRPAVIAYWNRGRNHAQAGQPIDCYLPTGTEETPVLHGGLGPDRRTQIGHRQPARRIRDTGEAFIRHFGYINRYGEIRRHALLGQSTQGRVGGEDNRAVCGISQQGGGDIQRRPCGANHCRAARQRSRPSDGQTVPDIVFEVT